MKNWTGTEGGKVRRNVPCVGMSVRMWKSKFDGFLSLVKEYIVDV